jgi:hypothetical protein
VVEIYDKIDELKVELKDLMKYKDEHKKFVSDM